MTDYILHYESASHKKHRYFVGSIQKPCVVHGYHLYPSWDYEKENATVLEGEKQAKDAKLFAEQCGYTDLILTPLDEDAPKLKLEETVPAAPVDAVSS